MVVAHFILLVALFWGVHNGMQYFIFIRDHKKLYYLLLALQGIFLTLLIMFLPTMLFDAVRSIGGTKSSTITTHLPYYALALLAGFVNGKKKLLSERVKVVLGSDPYANLELIRRVSTIHESMGAFLERVFHVARLPVLLLALYCIPYLANIARLTSGSIFFAPHPVLVYCIFWSLHLLKSDFTASLLFARIVNFKRQKTNQELDEEIKNLGSIGLNSNLYNISSFEDKKAYKDFLAILNAPKRLKAKISRKKKAAKTTLEAKS